MAAAAASEAQKSAAELEALKLRLSHVEEEAAKQRETDAAKNEALLAQAKALEEATEKRLLQAKR